MLRERSPLYAADRIKTPLVVVQGTNDPRVNRSQSDQLVSAMQRHGIQVEYLLAPDEGHSFAQYINAMAVFMTVEKLLAEHLGGRYQEAVPWQVSERLKAITVDPKSMVQLSSRSSVSIVSIPALGVLASTPKGGGAEIVGIQPRSAADLAGLHVADVIKFANDKPARTATELASLLSDHPSENTIRIGYTFPTSALGYLPKETVVHLQRVCGLGIPEN